jgi:hypothetical protein
MALQSTLLNQILQKKMNLFFSNVLQYISFFPRCSTFESISILAKTSFFVSFPHSGNVPPSFTRHVDLLLHPSLKTLKQGKTQNLLSPAKVA